MHRRLAEFSQEMNIDLVSEPAAAIENSPFIVEQTQIKE
jgi:hypothetical protein